jgi:hypothetical protein
MTMMKVKSNYASLDCESLKSKGAATVPASKMMKVYFDIHKTTSRDSNNVSQCHKRVLQAILHAFPSQVQFDNVENKSIDMTNYPSNKNNYKKGFPTMVFNVNKGSIFHISHVH